MSDGVRGFDRDVDLLFAYIEELRELAADPDLDDRKIYAFKIRWGAMLAGRLQRLAIYSADGKLSIGERMRYQQLRSGLREALPLIDRLRLGPVGVPLDEQ